MKACCFVLFVYLSAHRHQSRKTYALEMKSLKICPSLRSSYFLWHSLTQPVSFTDGNSKESASQYRRHKKMQREPAVQSMEPQRIRQYCVTEHTHTHTHTHASCDAIQPSHPLSSPSPLLSSIFPSIMVFSNESVLLIRWQKYWSFSFSINPSNEYIQD